MNQITAMVSTRTHTCTEYREYLYIYANLKFDLWYYIFSILTPPKTQSDIYLL